MELEKQGRRAVQAKGGPATEEHVMDNDTKPTIILVTDGKGPPALPCLNFFFMSLWPHALLYALHVTIFTFHTAIINKDFDIEYPECEIGRAHV